MKIRGKIYMIVLVLATVALSITGVALFAVSEYRDKLAEYGNASERAYKGEKLNRLVTAVVMDARGIYAAANAEKAVPFGDGMLKNLGKIDEVLTAWAPLVPEAQKAAFEAVVKRSEEFRTFRSETVRLSREESIEAANAQGNNESNRANRKAFQAEIDAVVETDLAALETLTSQIATFETRIDMILIITSAVGILAGLAIAINIASRQLSRPILSLTESMQGIVKGDLTIEVPFGDRQDEIGDMARAVEVLKASSLAVRSMNQDQEQARIRSVRLQGDLATITSAASAGDFTQRMGEDYGDADLNRFASGMNALVANVDAGITETRRVIASLAVGDLTQSMDGKFEGAFAELQANVNETLSSLQSMMNGIRGTTDSIDGNARELRNAADDLSRRTEQQAAALEETSAALDEITVAVRNSTDRAQEATVMVGEAKQSAVQSGGIVRNAVAAMDRIRDASSEIGQITNVIDEIAFQTNLLALNAGVEAARAGDAGKGFAVVAQEVRELAQRAAKAAKEIKVLISRSGTAVETGVQLVQETGTSLSEIESRVLKINDHIHAIATAAREQSTGLAEVSTAINQMDQVTQQNAAMVEEANAATHKLTIESGQLAELVGRFRVAESGARTRPTLATQSTPAAARPSPARSMLNTVARAFRPAKSGQAATAAATDDWQEF